MTVLEDLRERVVAADHRAARHIKKALQVGDPGAIGYWKCYRHSMDLLLVHIDDIDHHDVSEQEGLLQALRARAQAESIKAVRKLNRARYLKDEYRIGFYTAYCKCRLSLIAHLDTILEGK